MNAIENYHIKELLLRLLQNTYSDKDLLSFIDLSEKIAIGYLRLLQSMGKQITPSNKFKSSEFSQIAIDCIAPIFKRNENCEFVELKKFFGNRFDNEKPIDDLVLFIDLRRLVSKSVKQGLAIIFKERDPEGARLLRNIRTAIYNAQDIIVFENLSQDYVFSAANLSDPVLFRKFVQKEIDIHHPLVRKKLRRDLPLIPLSDLKNSYLGKYSPYLNIPTIIRNLLKIVSTKKEYGNYLTIDEIIGLTKDFKRREVPFSEFTDPIMSAETPEDAFDAKQIRQLQMQIGNRVSELIHQKYGYSQKFSPEVLSAFRKAIINFSENYIHAGKKISHFQLLKPYLPELTSQEYRQNYRHAFEYLVKSIRQELRTEIANIL